MSFSGEVDHRFSNIEVTVFVLLSSTCIVQLLTSCSFPLCYIYDGVPASADSVHESCYVPPLTRWRKVAL